MPKRTDIKKILIIGGSGLLGFHCSEELSADFEILATFNSTKLSTKNKKF